MAYVKPQVLVFQEFTIVPAEITEPLRAHISGPNAILHRYNNVNEKAGTMLGAYDPTDDATYLYPQRRPGSVVDQSYVKLFVDNALLHYFQHNASDSVNYVAAVAGKKNQVLATATEGHDAYRFKSNGAYSRTADKFYDRDVQVGDVVQLRGAVTVGETCEEVKFTTTVAGFIANMTSSVINAAAADSDNGNNDVEGNIVEDHGQIAGDESALSVAIDVIDYDGVYDGVLEETYTFEVVKSSVGCGGAFLRVRSSSGLDDVAEVAAPIGDQISIGTRGAKITFGASEGGEDLIIGQKWSFTVTQAYVPVVAISNTDGIYTGEYNDTYVIECTKGGYIDGVENYPQLTVRTAKGRDYSAPFEVTTSGNTTNNELVIGRYGVKVRFVDGSNGAVTRIAKGDKWYVSVTASTGGPINTLVLRDDIPQNLRDLETFDMSLFIKDDIQVSVNRLSSQTEFNYELEATQVIVKEGMTAYHRTWTNGGVPQPLNVLGGTLYLEYREWVADLADEVNAINNVGDLDNIPGQLDVDNPLKWGVYKALSNSLGVFVKYTAVSDPNDLDSWAEVLERVKGRDDIYNLVPLTFNREVQNMYAAHIGNESNEIANNWKAGFVAVQARNSKAVVGEGVKINDTIADTMDVVLATVTDNDIASGTQYTLLSVPAGNGYFITNNVQPGDIVRHSYIVNGFGETTYQESVVDVVLSESSLLLYAPLNAAILEPQKIEIWHNMNRNEMADEIAADAAAFASRRVCAVWPDQVGASGVAQPGYYLAAALAGLASSVAPHAPLTNVQVQGFDDYSRSYKMFNESQLNRMAEAGVWIVTEDRNGTPYTRHALTTDTLDLNRREEMIRRNVDSISYLFLRRMRPYIGRTNVSPGMLLKLTDEVNATIRFLREASYIAELGGQLTEATIRVLRVHPLLKDRIEMTLDLVVPAPLNNIEVHLVV